MAWLWTYAGKVSPLIISCCGCLAIVLFISLSGALSQPDLERYLPTATIRLASGKVTNWEKMPKAEALAGSKLALAVGSLAFTYGFRQFFVRFDRKNNLRLWPVVASGLTRSPPSTHGL